MRNLKRFLAFALTVAMILSVSVSTFAAYSDFTDKSEVAYEDGVSLLVELGIIAGYQSSDGTYYFDPTANVTRAETAKMICVALNGGKDYSSLYESTATNLTDVNASWAKGYIKYCYVAGIIAGKGNGLFAPAANVTGIEAAKMLLVALGYDATTQGLTGSNWSSNTLVLGNSVGLFEDLDDCDLTEALTREQTAQMIYNALWSQEVTTASDGTVTLQTTTGYKGVTDNGASGIVLTTIPLTWIYDKFDLSQSTGFVTANEYTGLTAGVTKIVTYDTDESTVTGTYPIDSETYYEVSTDLDMIGHKVLIYTKDDDSNDGSTAAKAATIYGDPVDITPVVTTARTAAWSPTYTLSNYLSDNDLKGISDTAAVYLNYSETPLYITTEAAKTTNSGSTNDAYLTNYVYTYTQYSTRTSSTLTYYAYAANAYDFLNNSVWLDTDSSNTVYTSVNGATPYTSSTSVNTTYGVALASTGAATSISEVQGLQNGKLMQLIDRDGDSFADAVYLTTYYMDKISAITSSTITLAQPLYGATGGTTTSIAVSKSLGTSDLASGDYVLVLDTGSAYVFQKAESVSGEITKVSSWKGPGDTGCYDPYIDGTEYSPCGTNVAPKTYWNGVRSFTASNVGNTYTLYLDLNGDMAACSEVEATYDSYDISYVVAFEAEEPTSGITTSDYTYYAYVVFSDGTKGVYEISSIDGDDPEDNTELTSLVTTPSVAYASNSAVYYGFYYATLSNSKVVLQNAKDYYDLDGFATGSALTDGSATISSSASKTIANSNTLYYYINSTYSSNKISSVTANVRTGYTNISDVTSGTVYSAYKTNDSGINEVVAVYTNSAISAGSSDVYYLFESYDSTYKESSVTVYEYTMYSSSGESQTFKSKASYTAADGAFYTVADTDGDSYYTLTLVTAPTTVSSSSAYYVTDSQYVNYYYGGVLALETTAGVSTVSAIVTSSTKIVKFDGANDYTIDDIDDIQALIDEENTAGDQKYDVQVSVVYEYTNSKFYVTAIYVEHVVTR